jgi:hypothetical protein
MSEHQPHDGKEHSIRDDVEDAVLAADDTGMIRSEANIVAAQLLDTAQIAEQASGADTSLTKPH